MDYINLLTDLPIDKDISIMGKVKPHESKYTNVNGKECVLRTYINNPPTKND
jgi:hypothetical protein